MNHSQSVTFQSAMAKLALFVVVMLVLFLSVVASRSDTALPEPLEHWYTAIGNGDTKTLSEVLSKGAIVQSALASSIMNDREFLNSFSSGAVPGVMAKFKTRLVAFNASDAEALVCYTISGHPVLTRESFRIRDGKVTQAIQEKLADNCEQF